MSRDTQFQGFAKLLLKDLAQEGFTNWLDCSNDGMIELIARRAYDLVSHACSEIDMEQDARSRRLLYVPMMESVPDMTEWPSDERVKRLEGIFNERARAFAPLLSLGVTFTDKQKEMIQKQISEAKEEE